MLAVFFLNFVLAGVQPDLRAKQECTIDPSTTASTLQSAIHHKIARERDGEVTLGDFLSNTELTIEGEKTFPQFWYYNSVDIDPAHPNRGVAEHAANNHMNRRTTIEIIPGEANDQTSVVRIDTQTNAGGQLNPHIEIRCVKAAIQQNQQAVFGADLDSLSQNIITENGDSYDFILGRKVEQYSPDFNSLWRHVAYPVESWRFSIPKSDCESILKCKSSHFISLVEKHIVGAFSTTRSAKMSVEATQEHNSASGVDETVLHIVFQAENGNQVARTLRYDPKNVKVVGQTNN